MPITPPLFLRGDDLYIFRSVAEAESWMEPADVEPGEQGYDAQGRLLHVLVRGEVRRGWISIDQSRARVEVVLSEDMPSHAEELRALLVDWLRRAESVPVLATATLDDLVERARKHAVRVTPVNLSKRVKVALCVSIVISLGVWIWRLAAR